MRAKRWQAPKGRVVLDIDYQKKNARFVDGYAPRDIANAVYALKAAIDGLVDAGVIADDDSKHVLLGEVRITATSGPGITLTIRREHEEGHHQAGVA